MSTYKLELAMLFFGPSESMALGRQNLPESIDSKDRLERVAHTIQNAVLANKPWIHYHLPKSKQRPSTIIFVSGGFVITYVDDGQNTVESEKVGEKVCIH